MRYLSADIIFPISSSPIKNGIIVIDDGVIVKILDPEKKEISSSINIERHEGVLCPGFVNTHCHLELSHLKGKFTQKKGLPHFIGEIVEKRNSNAAEMIQAMKDAESEMYSEGIVAVGDISNTSATIETKLTGKLFYHTFIEIFDISEEHSKAVFENGLKLYKEFTDNNLIASIVPHAHYTVSQSLMKQIFDFAGKMNGIISIHNQESEGENEMFFNGKGPLLEKLKSINAVFSNWSAIGKTSLSFFSDNIQSIVPLQLVHNTFIRAEDISTIKKYNGPLFWCLCVNANMFIENALPDIKKLTEADCMMTIGTDSYASNTSLSIINELITISLHFSEIKLADLLSWATLNGARFLRQENKLGSFEAGKKPGVNLISNVDLIGNKLQKNSKIERLI